ncbi:hypothetical protein FPQ18DRAFT_420455 [Pyronema domesticum]|nr:hypothetical protein FPQ18DRAFT_420455 [Pyronema domesticum]
MPHRHSRHPHIPQPMPLSYRSHTALDQLESSITSTFLNFQSHSLNCNWCHHPLRQYSKSKHLCHTGQDMAWLMSELLRHKAEYCLDGQFIVEIPHGYDAVDQAVRVMAHVHHDEYDLVIMDPEMYPMVAGERNRSEGWEIYRSMTRRNEEYERRSHGVKNGISMEKIRKEIKKQEKRDGNGYASPEVTRRPEMWKPQISSQNEEPEDVKSRSQPAEPEDVRSRRQPAGVLKKSDGVDDIRKIWRVLSRKSVHWD